jgi:hypothetical protein
MVTATLARFQQKRTAVDARKPGRPSTECPAAAGRDATPTGGTRQQGQSAGDDRQRRRPAPLAALLESEDQARHAGQHTKLLAVPTASATRPAPGKRTARHSRYAETTQPVPLAEVLEVNYGIVPGPTTALSRRPLVAEMSQSAKVATASGVGTEVLG